MPAPTFSTLRASPSAAWIAAAIVVTGGGREIRDLRLPVLLGCPNPGPTGGTILLRSPGVIRIGRIRVAPDGCFAKLQPDSAGVAEVSGRLVKDA